MQVRWMSSGVRNGMTIRFRKMSCFGEYSPNILSIIASSAQGRRTFRNLRTILGFQGGGLSPKFCIASMGHLRI